MPPYNVAVAQAGGKDDDEEYDYFEDLETGERHGPEASHAMDVDGDDADGGDDSGDDGDEDGNGGKTDGAAGAAAPAKTKAEMSARERLEAKKARRKAMFDAEFVHLLSWLSLSPHPSFFLSFFFPSFLFPLPIDAHD